MAGGLHLADIDLELKKEVSCWQKTEADAKETLLATILRKERKAENLNKINPSSFPATEKTFGICEETKTLISLDVCIVF